MGSCASIYRNADSPGKLRRSVVHSETDKNPNWMPSTPVKSNPVDQPIVSDLNSVTSFSNFGSKEEAFFDSQAWLESDCDDDFYSVKGDFTPSRGSTPIHSSRHGTPLSKTLSPQAINRAMFQANEPNRSFLGRTPQVDTTGIANQELSGSTSTNSSPTEKKKKLADLFRESVREIQKDEFNNEGGAETPKSSNTTPYISETNSQSSSAKRTPMDTNKADKEKYLKSAQCCFPRLSSARGFKKAITATPPIAVDA